MVVNQDEAGSFEPVETMDLESGDLCLDFTNTAGGRDYGTFKEKLRSYDDLVTWAERVELLDAERAGRLREGAHRSPGKATAVLERARELRESLYRLFVRDPGNPSDPSAGSPAAESRLRDDLARLEEESAAAWSERRLVVDGDDYRFDWPTSDRLEQILWPVALAAVELLTSDELDRVKECAADTCNWLFVDMSRNHSRRWCDMKVCGNRAKARRFSARQKGEDSA